MLPYGSFTHIETWCLLVSILVVTPFPIYFYCYLLLLKNSYHQRHWNVNSWREIWLWILFTCAIMFEFDICWAQRICNSSNKCQCIDRQVLWLVDITQKMVHHRAFNLNATIEMQSVCVFVRINDEGQLCIFHSFGFRLNRSLIESSWPIVRILKFIIFIVKGQMVG